MSRRYLLLVGSNRQARRWVRWGLERLEAFACIRHAGRVFRTPPEGMRTWRPFLNVAVALETPLDGEALKQQCVVLETRAGRRRDHPRSSRMDRALDLDILWMESKGWVVDRLDAYAFWPVVSLDGCLFARLRRWCPFLSAPGFRLPRSGVVHVRLTASCSVRGLHADSFALPYIAWR